MAGRILRWLSPVWTRLRQRLDLLLEFIVLRHQLAVLQRTGTRRPCFRPSERLFWLCLSRWWTNWRRSLIIVQPATVLRWRRRGLWAICLSGSCRRWRGGRPRINSEVRALIVRMSQENFLWGAPRIHGELLKLGFDVRKPQCPVTCQGAAIRPPRPGAPSCGTRHLGSLRSVLAKQVGYQTSFLLSSAVGSRELSDASPRCGMASVACLSSHR
jgi:putative transposase